MNATTQIRSIRTTPATLTAITTPTDRLRHRVKTVFAMIDLLLAARPETPRVPG